MGRYANSNPNYPQDWLDITRESGSEFDNSGEFNMFTGTCSLPSVHHIEVFYQKINTADNPLYTVAGMRHSVSSDNNWTFTNGDRTKKQRF